VQEVSGMTARLVVGPHSSRAGAAPTRLRPFWDPSTRRRAKNPAIKGADAKAWQLLWDRREDVMAQ